MTRRRYVQVDGELVDVTEGYAPEPKADFHVMPDLEPWRDTSGTYITGRAHWREHLKRTNTTEYGVEELRKIDPASYRHPHSRPVEELGRKEALKLAYDKIRKYRRPKGEVRALLDNVMAAHKRR